MGAGRRYRGRLRDCGPVQCAYDWQGVLDAPWIGLPSFSWPGFDLSFNAIFWGLLPGFVIVNMATTINSISGTVAIQQVAWRRPRATDFRVVQGAHSLLVLTNLLAAGLGTLPNSIGVGNSARVLLTGVAARRVGVYAGLILIVVAFSPKLIALAVAIPRPVVVAYICLSAGAPVCAGYADRFRGWPGRSQGRGSRRVPFDRHRRSKPGDFARAVDWDAGDSAQQRHDNRRSLRDACSL